LKLVMTLLVRDEQDIIRENIEYHLAQGVDYFIATDNKSVDATTDILKEYAERGLLHYIYEGDDNYNQQAWMTRMARLAFTEYGADWVINNDADEFWWPLEGDLNDFFKNISPQVCLVKADRHNFVVTGDTDKSFYSRMIYREKVSLNSLGRPLPPKVAHRGSGNAIVQQGNHSVTGLQNNNVIGGLIEILHFPVRSYQQIENKIALGGAAYERNSELPESIGITWRRLYADLKRDKNLDHYFQAQFYDKQRLELAINQGEIIVDNRLSDYLTKLNISDSLSPSRFTR